MCRSARIWNPVKLDPVNPGDLPARGVTGRLTTGDIVLILDVDRLDTGLEFLFDKFEGPGADDLLDLLMRVC